MRTFLLLLLTAYSAGAAEEPARDPTAWPATLRSAVAAAQVASSPASGADAPDNAIRQVVFVNGRAYIVQHGRRYGVGQQLEGARVERITEQAVWLREAGQVRREPLYGGVEKRPPAPPAQAASGVKKSKEKP